MDSLAEIRRRLRMARPHLTDDDISAVVHEVRRAGGQAGGQATSEAKRQASAANGRKGGRPPKKPRKTRKPNKPGERICEPSAGSKSAPADGSALNGDKT